MLDTATAETAVVALLTDMETRADITAAGRQQARRDFAQQLIAAVADLIRSGIVTATTTVVTAGGPATQTGTVTITNGKVS